MAALRSRKYLSCFCCLRRSKLRFEGQKSFVCSNCDATNWLDEHGGIVDPPTTSSVERSQVQFAIPRPSAPRSPSRSISPDGIDAEKSVFCDTCLRNQHMLTSSLAQFEWPDDQNSLEHVAREKKYWNLRKDLERRYPQMCAKCEPNVEKKLREASYTAQTDHLRRMMDRTRSQRRGVKKRGILDVFDYAGRWSWYLGFVLQFSWHIAIFWSLYMRQYTPTGTDSWIAAILSGAQHFVDGRLPLHTDQLMHWAINLGICSLPWNPRFKQTIRGFTAHYLGFKHWYTYQLLILLIRYAGLSMAQYSATKGLQISAQLGAQLAIALLMVFIYYASGRSIRTDTTPLFQQQSKMDSSRMPQPRSESHRDQNDLGSILDEISQSLPGSHAESTHRSLQGSNAYPTNTAAGGFDGSYDKAHENGLFKSTFSSLHVSDPVAVEKPQPRPQPQIIQYEEEMDWTPSASQHRAFSSYNPYRVKNTNPRFSDTPIEPKAGPIWYKVPPAPITPAQRLRNPPMRPIIRESPKEKKENFFQNTGRGPVDMGSSTQDSLSGIKFADPKFFAPQDNNDPRDSLSNMFASSFSISPSPDEEGFRGSRRAATNPLFKFSNGTVDVRSRRVVRFMELLVLAGALCVWVVALGMEEQYGPAFALPSAIASSIISVRLAADLQVDALIRGGKPPSIFALSWANLGLAQVIASLILAWNLWSGIGTGIPCRTYGSAQFATVIIHHMWHTFV
ncbi:Ima1 N-terminal domain-containing protein [Hypoxylon crocopeplum]|nr:Ima1 N-terminal domain-containing protein [Hypoxylon crocopeplum]